MLVAVAILALSLGALYQATGAATRGVGTDENYAYAVELARSLLALHGAVPATGLRDDGSTEGEFRWQVAAEPIPLPDASALQEGQLQHITVSVRWPDGNRERKFVLESVVAGREEFE